MSFKDKEILITGGTGSLGKTLVALLCSLHDKPHGIRVYSRDELKQWQMKQAFEKENISFILGDVRNLHRLRRAMEDVDIVIHAAAMKQVPACEDNPLEAIQTNVHGAENVLNAAIDCRVDKVMNVSTDKAVYPINLYGATKMAAEKLFIQGNVYSGRKGTKFSCCRYGNVLGSRGSVATVFKRQAASGEAFTISDKNMTRFWITMKEVSYFIINRILDMEGGEIFIPKMKAMSILDMMIAIAENEFQFPPYKEIGIRDGEKRHECIVTAEEKIVYNGQKFITISGFDYKPRLPIYSSMYHWGKLSAAELHEMLKESEI